MSIWLSVSCFSFLLYFFHPHPFTVLPSNTVRRLSGRLLSSLHTPVVSSPIFPAPPSCVPHPSKCRGAPCVPLAKDEDVLLFSAPVFLQPVPSVRPTLPLFCPSSLSCLLFLSVPSKGMGAIISVLLLLLFCSVSETVRPEDHFLNVVFHYQGIAPVPSFYQFC